jgi:hypothetical protein
MKKILFSVTILLLIAIAINAGDDKNYGKELTLEETTKVSQILEKPAEYEGKVVLIEGTVVNVCEKRGCWMEISGDKEFETIKVKVNDGEIIFPMEAKGKTALVQGEVYSFVPEVESECSEEEHKDGDKKEGCESEKKEDGCCSKDKVKKVYQIKGHGAIIKS